MLGRGRFNKLKMNPFIIIFFVAIIFCAFTLFPVQYILLYSKAIDRYNLAKRLLYLFLLNIIFILFNSSKNIRINKKIPMIFSFAFSIIYIFIISKFKIIYQVSKFSVLRSLIGILSLKYVLNAISIREAVKASLQEPIHVEEGGAYIEAGLQNSKYSPDNFYYSIEMKNRTANMELVGASVLIGCIAFIPDENFLWIFLILVILNIIKSNHNKSTLFENMKKRQ